MDVPQVNPIRAHAARLQIGKDVSATGFVVSKVRRQETADGEII